MLKSEVAIDRSIGIYALGKMGADAKDSVPGLVVLFRSGDLREQVKICQALQGIGPAAAESVDFLLECLDDENEELRLAATQAIKQIAPERLTE
jgi:HEAT repeat protein